MFSPRLLQRTACAFMPLLLFAAHSISQEQPAAPFPHAEKLSYRIEWRLVNAGDAQIEMSRTAEKGWAIDLKLESAGLVTRLYRVEDTYKLISNEQFCGENSVLNAEEGKRRSVTRLLFDRARHKAVYEERDLVKNQVTKNELDVPACTYDVVGALAMLRTHPLEPGKSITVPITNGKKFANARIDAQAKETISVSGKSYSTVRYEAFLFDNVVYKRHGRLLFWITDDPERIPVQFRVQIGFPIGTITVELEKHEKF